MWVALALVALLVAVNLVGVNDSYTEIPTSQAVSLIDGTEPMTEVILTAGDQTVRIRMNDSARTRYKSTYLEAQTGALADRLDKRVAEGSLTTWKAVTPTPSIWSSVAYIAVPVLLMALVLWWIMRSMQGGGRGVMGFGKSKARIANKDTPSTLFSDVAGCEEAIEELREIRDFLSDPARFERVGAKIPKGVLLYGPPGTGKTLLARAVAGEAGVPFFSMSGSDFVEMFVGVGASRVRDLFEQAKQEAPAIVFIDEIDAVGRHRGAGTGGGHDEREQTLNQLLVEMDGFAPNEQVILIAATNRPDVLDPALLRPGRFDRQIPVEAPDMAGRLMILRVHAKGKPMADDVDLAQIAQRTPGMTGADLANVLNEAALLTARLGLATIGRAQLAEAIDRVLAGPQKHSRIMDEHEVLVTAYHEGGHALVAAAMPGNDPVQKITILPRGRALGYTMVMPDSDKYSNTRSQLLDQMAYMMGGRAAEELVFHDPTTGASNDIEKATKVARAMITQYGMSERVGSVQLGSGDSEPFLGMGYQQGRDYSERSAAIVDEEIAKLVENAHQEAFDTLVANRAVLDELVRQLVEHETLDRAAVARIFAGLTMHPPRGSWTGSPSRVPSVTGPISVPALHARASAKSSPLAPPEQQGPWQPPSSWSPPAAPPQPSADS
ncbi:cell division protease FtsH [Propionibacterium cyclohexanicum]|uniref:ATP-dependent zinc metalloprotease FtsH n=1 Tax=Propionibacterium cyclohexanicum TaxID=64702 RepID=A0A1H9RUI6_9ACTN|nr:cell division protease FtsH [Propionibacterium cyclohexanicum]